MKLDSVMNSEDHFGSMTISPDAQYVFFMWVTPRPDVSGETPWVMYWVDAAVPAPVESPG